MSNPSTYRIYNLLYLYLDISNLNKWVIMWKVKSSLLNLFRLKLSLIVCIISRTSTFGAISFKIYKLLRKCPIWKLSRSVSIRLAHSKILLNALNFKYFTLYLGTLPEEKLYCGSKIDKVSLRSSSTQIFMVVW